MDDRVNPVHCSLSCVVHNVSDAIGGDIETKVRQLLEPHVLVSSCCQKLQDKTPLHLGHSVAITVSPQHDVKVKSQDDFARWFKTVWCTRILSTSNVGAQSLWLQIDHLPPSNEYRRNPTHTLNVCQLSLGTFTSPGVFVNHWKSKYSKVVTPLKATKASGAASGAVAPTDDDEDIEEATEIGLSALFDHDNDLMQIRWKETEDEQWRLDLKLEHLAERVLLVTDRGEYQNRHVYLFLYHLPKIFHGQLRKALTSFDEVPTGFQWERHVQFGMLENGGCDKKTFGSSNVLRLDVPVEANIDNLLHRLQRLQKQEYVVYYASPTEDDFRKRKPVKTLRRPRFESFDAAYAWFCLTSYGFKVSDQLTEEVIRLVETRKDDAHVARMLSAVIRAVDDRLICDIKQVLKDQMETESQRQESAADELALEGHLVSVRRIVLTPTTMRGLPAEAVVGNRVVREFGADRFIRVVVRDEDLEQLSASGCKINEPVKVVTGFLSRDLFVDDRRYHFLGSSNSQLREHGFWMYASDGKPGHTVEEIRRWMGDLSQERCVASYVSRLGQFFSAARKTIEVENVEHIPDVNDNGYCFTDGIGKISPLLAKKVSKTLGLGYKPSAYQIRFGGCKGVLAISPDQNGEKIQVRDSMEKFQSDHNDLEVVGTTLPGRLHLNRQVITLMSGLEVPNNAFFNLQESMLRRLADMMIKEDEAAKALAKLKLGLPRELLTNGEIVITTEPYFRKLLLAIYRRKLAELMTKARIEIPVDKGRSMMGTVDETGSLSYGEVFIQYSEDIDIPHRDLQVYVGPVVIAKNPCFHPGDMRKFHAVNKPALKHMVDCVVFPAKGERPHPNEMSGSDLDGDMYFVCWEESLLPPNNNNNPMDYTAPTKQQLDRPITERDMVAYFGKYIKSDRLGVIANSHLVHADSQETGIFSQQCLKLAQMHSDAVDFPKTGSLVLIPPELRPQSYPRFMEKHDKPVHESYRVLALLYDQCQVIDSAVHGKGGEIQLSVNNDFVFPGYEIFLDPAEKLRDFYNSRMQDIMSSYGVATEEEVVTGHIFKFTQKRRGTLKREHLEVADLIRCQIQSLWSKTKAMFLEEFGGECSNKNDKMRAKASALYVATYSDPRGAFLSLPWLFMDLLILGKRTNGSSGENTYACCQKMQSSLQKLSYGIRHFSKSCDSRETRVEAFERMQSELTKINHLSVDLIVFGSTVTGFDDIHSTLDLLVVSKSSSPPDTVADAISVLSQQLCGRSLLTVAPLTSEDGKPVQLHFDENVKICLYSLESYIKRTAFILATMDRNEWMIRVLHVILTWARAEDVVGTDRESLLTAEQFILLFIGFVTNNIREFCPCDALDLDKAFERMRQNRVASPLFDDHCDCCLNEADAKGKYFRDLVYDRRHTLVDHADVLLQFLYFYSCLRGQALKTCCDPAFPADAGILIDLMDPQYQLVADRLIQAYHLLASSGSVGEFLQLPTAAEGHIVLDLSRQASSCIIYVEEHFEQRLMRTCHADLVKIRKKPFRDSLAGLIVEAWGSQKALEMVQNKVRQLEKMSSLFAQSNVPLSRQLIAESYVTTFEGSHGDDEVIRFMPHQGSVQNNHFRNQQDGMTYVPWLLDADTSSQHNVEKIIANVMRQLSVMRKSYDETIHGSIRAVISFGTYYIITSSRGPPDMREADFDRKMNRRNPGFTAGLVNLDKRTPRGRGFYKEKYSGQRNTYTNQVGISRQQVGSPFAASNVVECMNSSVLGSGEPGRRRSGDPRPRLQLRNKTENFDNNRRDERQSSAASNLSPSYSPTSSQNSSNMTNFGSGSPTKHMPFPDSSTEGKPFSEEKWKHSFIPASNRYMDDKKLTAFLKENRFVVTDEKKEYRISVKLKLQDYVSGIDGVLLLDEDFRLQGLTLPDIKWLCANIVTIKNDHGVSSPSDVRFKIHSRLAMTCLEMSKHAEDCDDLIKNHRNLLRCDDQGLVVGVHPDYIYRIHYVRYKDVKTYQLAGNLQQPTTDKFLYGMKIRVNRGKEFESPNRYSGDFRKIDEVRTEVTILPALPDLNDDEKMRAFLTRMWTFAKEFGLLLA